MLTGQCLCGACRFEISGGVGPANYCHCADCRRATGSAFNIGVRVDIAGFKMSEGSPRAFTKVGDSGGQLMRHFCADCGSPLFTSSPQHPQFVYVKAGVLDDPYVVVPSHQSWIQSEVSWAHIPDDLPLYSKGRGS
jgi:hypothetical protein